MSQVCNRCQRIVHRACQSDTETADCPNLRPAVVRSRIAHAAVKERLRKQEEKSS